MLIETERLILKNFSLNDLDVFHSLRSNELIAKYSTLSPIKLIEDSEKLLKQLIIKYRKNNYNFKAIFLKETMECIGEAGVLAYNKENNRAVIGYNLLPKYWGKSYATEISKELIRFLFEDLNVQRVEALVVNKNIASKKVLLKCGFILDGILRNYAYINNEYCDICHYGIISSDYRK